MALPEPDEDAIEVFERLEEDGPSRAAVVRLRLALADDWPPAGGIPDTREGAEFEAQCSATAIETMRWCAEVEAFLAQYVDAVEALVCQAGRRLGAALDDAAAGPAKPQRPTPAASDPTPTVDLDAVRKDAGAAAGARGLDWSDKASVRAPRTAQAVALDLLGAQPDGSIAGIVESVRRLGHDEASEHDAVLLQWAQASQLRSLKPKQTSDVPTDPRLVEFRLRLAWAAGGEIRAQALSADHPSLLPAARRVVERQPDRQRAHAMFQAVAIEAGHPSGIEPQPRGPHKQPRRFAAVHAILLVILVVLFVATYVLQK